MAGKDDISTGVRVRENFGCRVVSSAEAEEIGPLGRDDDPYNDCRDEMPFQAAANLDIGAGG